MKEEREREGVWWGRERDRERENSKSKLYFTRTVVLVQ